MASICYTSAEEAWLMLGSPGLLSSSRMLISNWEWVSFLEISKVQISSIPSVPLPRPQMELGELHIHLKKFQRWLWYAFPVKYFFEMVSVLWKSTVTWASQVGLVVKNPSANVEDIRDAGSVPGLGDPLEKGMATHSSILAWKIPWTEEPGELQSLELQRVKYNWRDSTHMNTRVDSLPHIQRIFPAQELNWGLLHCRWILYQLSYQGSPSTHTGTVK